jgi:hypothetical protein
VRRKQDKLDPVSVVICFKPQVIAALFHLPSGNLFLGLVTKIISPDCRVPVLTTELLATLYYTRTLKRLTEIASGEMSDNKECVRISNAREKASTYRNRSLNLLSKYGNQKLLFDHAKNDLQGSVAQTDTPIL